MIARISVLNHNRSWFLFSINANHVKPMIIPNVISITKNSDGIPKGLISHKGTKANENNNNIHGGKVLPFCFILIVLTSFIGYLTSAANGSQGFH